MRRITESLVSFVSWHRRAVGALLAVLAVLTLGHSLALGPPTTAVVMVTAPIAATTQPIRLELPVVARVAGRR